MTVNFKMGADNFYEKNMKFVEVSVENKERCSILDRPSGFVIKYPGQYVQDGLQDKRMSRQHPCLPKIIKRHINIFYLPFPNTMVFSIFPYGVIEQYFKQERIFHRPFQNILPKVIADVIARLPQIPMQRRTVPANRQTVAPSGVVMDSDYGLAVYGGNIVLNTFAA